MAGQSDIYGRLADGTPLPIRVTANGDGTGSMDISAGVTLSASDIQIGAVEIKNDITDDRVKVGTDNHMNVVTRNRSDWKVKQIDTGGVIDTPVAGPSQAIPDGYSVLVQADAGNTQAVQVGSVGETGAAGTRFVLQPGDVLPITLKVDNMDAIEARSVLGTNEIVNLIAEV